MTFSKDIKSMNIRNWKKVAQNRESWKKVVEQARTSYRLQHFIRRPEDNRLSLLVQYVSQTNCRDAAQSAYSVPSHKHVLPLSALSLPTHSLLVGRIKSYFPSTLIAQTGGCNVSCIPPTTTNSYYILYNS
jgi:hypothetical protein